MNKLTHRSFAAATLLACALLAPPPAEANATEGDSAVFKSKIEPFLENYCLDCHDDETQKGGVSLHDLTGVTYGDSDLWTQIWEQVALKEMPPRKKKNQPESLERHELAKTITSELAKARAGKGGFTSHLDPTKANHLEHDLLFNTTHKNLVPASSPARIWRIHPLAHVVRLNELIAVEPAYDPTAPGRYARGDRPVADLTDEIKICFGVERYAETNNYGSLRFNKLSHGFHPILAASKGHGLGDYAHLHGVNGSEAMQVIQVAEKILHFMVHGPESIIEKHKHGTSKITYSKEVKRPLTPVYDLIKEPGISDERITAAVNYLFEKLTLRKPTQKETNYYFEIANHSIRELGKEKGAIPGLAPIFASHHALFHRELVNYGTPDEYGRIMLEGQELVLAINHAFCDLMPDHKLNQALSEGQLKTKADVEREVTRILNDDSIRKPRLLQFFREYFDYGYAASVFKDNSELKKIHRYQYAGSDRSNLSLRAAMVNHVANTDRLIELILQEDKDVLKELLTTDRVIYGDADAIYYRNIDNPRWFLPPFTFYRTKTSKHHPRILKDKNGIAFPLMHDGKGKRFSKRKGSSKDTKPTPYKDYDATKTAYTKLRDELLNDVFPGVEEPIQVRLAKAYYHGVNSARQGDIHSRTLTRLNKTQRKGILTHPSWLVAHSDNTGNHVILRGKWIRERLLGDAVPEIPITVDAQLPVEPKSTLRHRMRVTSKDECWRCHKKMDPLGFPFEMFNHLGMYREKEQGKPVDTTGEIIYSGDPELDGPVTNALDMIEKLANSERVEQVFVRHAFRFWMGRNETINDAPILQAAHKAYKDSGGSMKALLTSLLTSDAFLYRTVDRSSIQLSSDGPRP